MGFTGFFARFAVAQELIGIRLGWIFGYGERRKPSETKILKIPPILILTKARVYKTSPFAARFRGFWGKSANLLLLPPSYCNMNGADAIANRLPALLGAARKSGETPLRNLA